MKPIKKTLLNGDPSRGQESTQYLDDKNSGSGQLDKFSFNPGEKFSYNDSSSKNIQGVALNTTGEETKINGRESHSRGLLSGLSAEQQPI